MRSIILTYPEFQSLPQGVKKLLVTSETFFFSEPQPPCEGWAGGHGVGLGKAWSQPDVGDYHSMAMAAGRRAYG